MVKPQEISVMRQSCSDEDTVIMRETTPLSSSTTTKKTTAATATDRDNIGDILKMSDMDFEIQSNNSESSSKPEETSAQPETIATGITKSTSSLLETLFNEYPTMDISDEIIEEVSETSPKDEQTTAQSIVTENTNSGSLLETLSEDSPTLDVSIEIEEEVGETDTLLMVTSTTEAESFLFPDGKETVKLADTQLPSLEDPFSGSEDPTLNVSHGLGLGGENKSDAIVFSDMNKAIELEISNATIMAIEDVTPENMNSLEFEKKSIGEDVETNVLSTEVSEAATDQAENTRESRLLESPTAKTATKNDGEIHFEKIYRGTSNTLTYSLMLIFNSFIVILSM